KGSMPVAGRRRSRIRSWLLARVAERLLGATTLGLSLGVQVGGHAHREVVARIWVRIRELEPRRDDHEGTSVAALTGRDAENLRESNRGIGAYVALTGRELETTPQAQGLGEELIRATPLLVSRSEGGFDFLRGLAVHRAEFAHETL